MKNKLNVVAVNCDAHPRLCSAEGIEGYPTLKMYVLYYASMAEQIDRGLTIPR